MQFKMKHRFGKPVHRSSIFELRIHSCYPRSLTIWLLTLSRLAVDKDILHTFESLVLCTSLAYLIKYFTYVTLTRLICIQILTIGLNEQLFKLYFVPYIGCAHVPSYSPSA